MDCTAPQGPGASTTITWCAMEAVRMCAAKTHTEKEVMTAGRAGETLTANKNLIWNSGLWIVETEGERGSTQSPEAAAWLWGLGRMVTLVVAEQRGWSRRHKLVLRAGVGAWVCCAATSGFLKWIWVSGDYCCGVKNELIVWSRESKTGCFPQKQTNRQTLGMIDWLRGRNKPC